MTLEYVLLLFMFVTLLMTPLAKGPIESFKSTAPKLGARVEKHLITGNGFKVNGQEHKWVAEE